MTHDLLFILLANAEVCKDDIMQVIDRPHPFTMMLVDLCEAELQRRTTYRTTVHRGQQAR